MAILSYAVFSLSCRKTNEYLLPKQEFLSFSRDTVKFDTVFTGKGSATINFLFKNTTGAGLKISSIRLAGGQNSAFRLNIDGRATTEFKDYEIEKDDSAFIFVEVTIDPSNLNNPFVVMDSILFNSNGITQKVILEAYGQNVTVYRDGEQVPCNTTWISGKPYLLDGVVIVPTNCTLTILPGTKVYGHRNALLLVAGTVIMNGSSTMPITFSGDRLENIYKSTPGQWGGIRFIPKSYNNYIKNTIIENGIVGIEVDSLPNNRNTPNLIIENSIIRNMSSVGIIGYTASISGKNLLAYSCGQAIIAGEYGGTYSYVHCTFENSVNVAKKRTPSIYLSNANFTVVDANGTIINNLVNDLNAEFYNCIITGSLDDELNINKSGAGKSDTLFRSCIIKAQKNKFANNNYININPKFKNIFDQNYTLDTLSPAVNKGILLNGVNSTPNDITGKLRDQKPDLGCYER
ncbi:MAG: hypothetical protein SGJ04_02050 [Bacteroidota bacterium]|nr:hypothetical protein [Bacteroidota bacterium]